MRPSLTHLTICITVLSIVMVAPVPAGAVAIEEALRAALSQSLALQSARKSWLASREDIGTAISTSEWRTTGTLTGNQYKTDTKGTTKNGFIDSQSVNATVSLSRNLYDGGQTDENVRLGAIRLDIAGARYKAAEQQVLLGTIETYLSVLKANREVVLNENNVARLEEHVNATRLRLEAGAVTQTQLAQAEARLSRARTTLIDALTNLHNYKDLFLTATGLEAGNLDPDIDAGMLPVTLIEADKMARQYNSDVGIARLTVDVSMQQFNALMASVKPTVAFSLNATESMADETRSDKTELSAQIKLSSPLMPTGSIRAKSRSLLASLEAAKLDRDNALRSASLAVRNAFRNLEKARSHSAAANAELAASRLVSKGINNEFQFGQKTTLDVLDAEQDVSDAELRVVSADHEILMAAFRLRAASGMLSASSFNLDGVLGPLQDIQPIKPRFTSWMPLNVEWPEGDGGSMDIGAADAPINAQPKTEQTSLVVPVEEPEPVAVTATAVLPSPNVIGPVIAENGGIVWDIRTNQP